MIDIALFAPTPPDAIPPERRAASVAEANLARDVFGNPLRPMSFASAWRTTIAVSLACHMYGSRDFSAMPILADALQDVGCDKDDILDHCRGPGPHVRGRWVVDLCSATSRLKAEPGAARDTARGIATIAPPATIGDGLQRQIYYITYITINPSGRPD